MPWAGQTWLEVIQEGTGGANYGTFNSTPGAGQTLYPSLVGGNSFTVRALPLRQIIRTADAGNRRRNVVAGRKQYQGVLNTILYPDQAAFWITAASALTNDAGGHPWLPSYSALYWDSIQAWKLLGGMIQSLTLTSSSTQDYVTLSASWIFQTRDPAFTTFPQPAESNYTTLVPYEHIETAGYFTLGTTPVAVTKYRSLTLTFTNTLAPTWDELPIISALYYCGRDFNISFGHQYTSTTDRVAFEGQTPLTFVVGWNRTSPAHALSVNCKTNSYYGSVDDDLPLDGPGYQNINVEVFFDPAASTDFTTTVT